MKIQIVQPKSEESPQKSILKTSIRGPLVAMVLLLTLGLTTMFYFSQDTRVDVYSRYIETLSEYKFLEARLMRPLENSKHSLDVDSAAVEAGLMTLREIAVSLSSALENNRADESWVTTVNRVDGFEREVLNKVSIARRFLKERRSYLNELALVLHDEELPKNIEPVVKALIAGKPINPDLIDGQDSLSLVCKKLAQKNLDHMEIWSRIDNSRTVLWVEDLIIDLKARSVTAMEWKYTLSLVFYLLSIAMLLLTLLLYVRVKHD